MVANHPNQIFLHACKDEEIKKRPKNWWTPPSRHSFSLANLPIVFSEIGECSMVLRAKRPPHTLGREEEDDDAKFLYRLFFTAVAGQPRRTVRTIIE
ncbi:uncharacterized protein EI90DRAFT_289881 [Cantharellus anzutake]|uniref:uncharacterized protein n=1 Tax=Cantharellus anzutake TaxID=1750568 RepID=UPI0019073959|nr:uncharacterized protein EI90DRAFT_289881 [Cantharellus anzutake]KAF8316198.1 hypothetical protein EI90DRAFT_289881 [Cantharellus anzutake]